MTRQLLQGPPAVDDEPSRCERFEAAILVHLDAAYNLARWLLRDDAAAQDAVQDASLRAFRYFDGMLGPTPKAWFMAIVRRACLDWIEHETKRCGKQELYDDEVHGLPLLDAGGAVESPESLAILASDLRQLQGCLAALPREFREVLVLRELEELSYREIGTVIGIPIGTVMSRLSRAREQLAQRMRAASAAARKSSS